ncbi:MAG TPA: hypothetical protein VNA25_17660 [Phycisphaerae bacterium]|nr:hypothetical protein [Phycisphaerae bacterium]
MADISPHAVVEQGAELADDVRVGAFTYVGPEVRVGGGCVIENNVTLAGRTVLGRNNHVFPMCVIGAADDGPGAVIVGDANSIREHVTVCGGPAEPTRIGRDNLIMIDCHVGAGALVGDHCIFANCTHVGPGAAIEDYIRTSGFTRIEQGVTVGAYTFIAGFAGVDRDAPPYAIVQGFPYRVRGVNAQNLKRCGFGDEDIKALKQAFHAVFNGQDDQPSEKAIRKLSRARDINPRVAKLLEAIRGGKAGEGS